MKLLWAGLVYLLFAFMIGWGILLTVHGKPWLLIAAAALYLVLLARIGCTEKGHG